MSSVRHFFSTASASSLLPQSISQSRLSYDPGSLIGLGHPNWLIPDFTLTCFPHFYSCILPFCVVNCLALKRFVNPTRSRFWKTNWIRFIGRVGVNPGGCHRHLSKKFSIFDMSWMSKMSKISIVFLAIVGETSRHFCHLNIESGKNSLDWPCNPIPT